MYYPADFQNYETNDGFNNDYDKVLNYVCSTNEALNYIKSRHSNFYEDRQFKLGCLKVTTASYPLEDCQWYRYVNDWDDSFIFTCPSSHVMTGMYSEHDNFYEDRIWKYQCCKTKNGRTENCVATDYVNDFDQEFICNANNNVFIGAHSYHSNYEE